MLTTCDTTTLSFEWIKPGMPIIALASTIDGFPARLSLDTGNAEGLALSEAFAKRLGLEFKELADKTPNYGVGRDMEIRSWDTKIGRLRVGEFEEADVSAHISTYVDYLGKAVSAPLDGNIGYDLLRSLALIIDYPQQTLTLQKTPSLSSGGFPFYLGKRPWILVDTEVNGRGLFTFVLDTGASLCILSPSVATQASVVLGGEVPMQGATGVVKGRIAKDVAIQVGNAGKRSVSVAVGDIFADFSEVAGVEIGGIVGFNYFKDSKLTIDYPNRIVRFD